MKLTFTKMHGLGNDFIFIDDPHENLQLSSSQVQKLCDRHFGIGADGIIAVRPSQFDDCVAYMHYLNSDGSLSQMCGNGLRCLAKFLVDRKRFDPAKGEFILETLEGKKPITYETNDENKLTLATVDMGEPRLNPADLPVLASTNAKSEEGQSYVEDLVLSSPWGNFSFTCVSMGNPHAVCFIRDWCDLPDEVFSMPNTKSMDTFDLDKVGAFFESCDAFPEKTNVEFVEIKDDGLYMRVYERGCAETLACGTGSCAVGVAARLTGCAGRDNEIYLKGGSLHIAWDKNNHVYMTGPACEVFEGRVEI